MSNKDVPGDITALWLSGAGVEEVGDMLKALLLKHFVLNFIVLYSVGNI